MSQTKEKTKTHMKQIKLYCLITLLFAFMTGSFTVSGQVISLDKSNKSELVLLGNTEEMLSITSTVGKLNIKNAKTENGSFVKLTIDGYGKSMDIGSPELPVIRKLIEIPLNAEIVIEIKNQESQKVNLNERGITKQIFPAQPPQPKCGECPEFEINNEIYSQNDFVSHDIVSVDYLGILRGVSIARLNISPVSYNPITNELEIIQKIDFEIKYKNADLQATKEFKKKTYSPYFEGVYRGLLNNKNNNSRDYITQYPVHYLIVSDRMFENQLADFVTWKKRKGFIVTEAYTDVIGSSLQDIKTYIEGLYNSGTPENPAPSFVLFVGDIAQIPAWDNGNGVTDRNYVEYTGDLFPEIYYGRFSAENADQLQPFIDKSLMVEQYTMAQATYLDTVVMIAGVDGSHGNDWGNGQINYGTINYFNEDHDIYSHTYLYPASGSSSSAIIQNISDGVAFANYTAHCSPNGWGDPSFSISDISSLQNDGKYGLLIGNCCSSSEYQTNCFGEEIVRAANKGAVGYIGGSNSTYWDEDYYFGVGVGTISENPPPYEETTLGNYDRAFHDHGETFSEWFITMDQHVFAGNLAVSESGSSAEQYYWDIYNLMGDPSLMIYYSVPEVNPVAHDPYIMVGSESFTVNCAPYSYVALNYNGDNKAVVMTDQTGVAVLQFQAFSQPGTAELVITAQNFQPYFEDVLIFAPDGPFCIYQSHTINDDSLGNGNGSADFGEEIFISLSMVNYGSENAEEVDVTISSDSPYVIIEDGFEPYGSIAIDQIVTKEDGFLISLTEDIPDQTNILFTVLATDINDSTWSSEFEITGNAPELTALEMVIDDSEGGNDNGRLDPGETAKMRIKTKNTGHCAAYNVVASIEALNPYITVLTGDTTYATLGTFAPVYSEYTITVDPNAPVGTFAEMKYELTSGYYNTIRNYYPKIGLVVEDWETGNFNKFNWKFSGNLPWVISTSYPYEGYFDVVSGDITDNQTSEFYIQYQTMASDTISFYKKVSTEVDFDKLLFYIDNEIKGEWSGTTQGWTKESFPVSAGTHKFRWVYSKDYSSIAGADQAWIDYIVLPTMMMTTIYAGQDDYVCENHYYQCDGSATNYSSVYWETSGTGTFENPQSFYARYYPSEEDLIQGNVNISFNQIDVDGNYASDTLLLSFNYLPEKANIPVGPEEVDLLTTSQTNYYVSEIPDAVTYEWILSPDTAGTINGNDNNITIEWNQLYEGDVWLKTAGNNSCGSGVFSDSLHIAVTNTTDISNPEEKISLTLIPNPTKGIFVINFNSDINQKAEVSIVNQLGSKVYTNKFHIEKGINKLTLNIEDDDNGIYFVNIKTEKSIITKKLLLVK